MAGNFSRKRVRYLDINMGLKDAVAGRAGPTPAALTYIIPNDFALLLDIFQKVRAAVLKPEPFITVTVDGTNNNIVSDPVARARSSVKERAPLTDHLDDAIGNAFKDQSDPSSLAIELIRSVVSNVPKGARSATKAKPKKKKSKPKRKSALGRH
jgi:hypothetical protein